MQSFEAISIRDGLDGILSRTEPFETIIPKNIYLFVFLPGKDMFRRFIDAEYEVKELRYVGPNPVVNADFLWSRYVEYISDPTADEYHYARYVDDDGCYYDILVDAVGRDRPFKNGDLPYPCRSLYCKYYADIYSELMLPDCFRTA